MRLSCPKARPTCTGRKAASGNPLLLAPRSAGPPRKIWKHLSVVAASISVRSEMSHSSGTEINKGAVYRDVGKRWGNNKVWYRNPGPARMGRCHSPRPARAGGPGGCPCRDTWQELRLQRGSYPTPNHMAGRERRGGGNWGVETVTPSSSLLANGKSREAC